MGWYQVLAPCVVDGLHYIHPTTQPIEVDDDRAAELVVSGALVPYGRPGGVTADLVAMSYSMRHPEGVPFVVADDSPEPDPATSFTEQIEPGTFKATARRARKPRAE